MSTFNRLPISAPDDGEAPLSPSAQPRWSRVEAILGRALQWGFISHIIYTFVQWQIMMGTTARTRDSAINAELLWLVLPLLGAALGALKAKFTPSTEPLHPLACSALLIAMCLLGMFNLFILFVTSWPGYC